MPCLIGLVDSETRNLSSELVLLTRSRLYGFKTFSINTADLRPVSANNIGKVGLHTGGESQDDVGEASRERGNDVLLHLVTAP